MKMTVKDYASRFKISPQAVYQKLNNGSLKYIKENGTKYVIVDNKQIQELEQSVEQVSCNYLLKQLQSKENKIDKLERRLDKREKEIKRLNKALLKSISEEKETLLNYIAELKQLQISYIPKEDQDEIIDLEDPPKKKKKKHKKKKGKR